MIEEDEGYFDYKHAMKVILYDGCVKVDSKIYSTQEFLDESGKINILTLGYSLRY